jgi:hypothetical protein
MPKTQETLDLEKALWKATQNQGTFGCFEVTIGWFGKERVDYLTYDTKGIFRCYEIKVTKADFHSKASKTFVGHLNYYVMPEELYNEVKDEIPSHIGVHNGTSVIKKPKRQELKVSIDVLKDSLIRSLCREVENYIKSNTPSTINYYKSEIARLQRERTQIQHESHEYYQKYCELRRQLKKEND